MDAASEANLMAMAPDNDISQAYGTYFHKQNRTVYKSTDTRSLGKTDLFKAIYEKGQNPS